jgi:hypothetical protein
MPDPIAIQVQVRVTHRGGEVSGEGTIRVDDDAVRVTTGARQMRARYERLTGLSWLPPRLTIHVATGDVIEAEGALERVAAEIDARACSIPELTRALRGLGGAAEAARAAHDILFAPLLDARRAAEAARTPNERLSAFDAAGLQRAVERSIALIASSRHGDSPPHRRALEAMLLEEAEALLERLGQIGEAADRVRTSAASDRFAAWREWVAAVRGAFAAADRAWSPTTRVLATR